MPEKAARLPTRPNKEKRKKLTLLGSKKMPKGVVRGKLRENYIADVEEMWSAIIHGRRFPPSSPSLPPSTQLYSIPYLLFSSRTVGCLMCIECLGVRRC